eukprot:gene22255-25219_t
MPNCGDYNDCYGCASQDQCAWCASDNTCNTISDAFSKDCRGLVFEPPCPSDFIPENVVVGNLVVRADPTFGGGELNVSGSGMTSDGTRVDYQMSLNTSGYFVNSAGDVGIISGDRNTFNAVGGNVSLTAGSGLSPQGGSGGSVVLKAGDGEGEDQFGGNIGQGGDVSLQAGDAVQGAGGAISLEAGSSALGKGGMISIKSGDSLGKATGDVIISSAASSIAKSGDVSLGSGASSQDTGDVSIQSGDSLLEAGSIFLTAGTSGSNSVGALVRIRAGDSTGQTGGLISIVSGTGGPGTASGAISIASEDATAVGDSGPVYVRTGAAVSGSS